MPEPQLPPLTRLNLLTLVLLITALWLATRPYPGIYNDARFYTLEALNALHPGRYADDLYFKYGSQDQFSIFTKLFAPLVGAVGISIANIIGVLLCQFLFVTGLFYFATGFIADKRTAIIAAVAVIILPFHIGFIDTGENFLTPRLPADALCLWAFGAMLRQRPILSLILLSIAMPIHPLLALGAFGVFFIYQAWDHKLWWLAAAAAILAALGLAFAGIQPFSRLFVTFDPTWLAIISVRASNCFIRNWGFNYWPTVVSATAIGIYALFIGSKAEQRLLLASLIIGWGGIIASYIGGDLLHNVLILDSQSWRAFWPFGIVTYFMLPKIYRQMDTPGPVFFFRGKFYLQQAICWFFIGEFFGSLILVASPMALIASCIGIYEFKTRRQMPPLAGIICTASAISLNGLGAFGIYLGIISPDAPTLILLLLMLAALVAVTLIYTQLSTVLVSAALGQAISAGNTFRLVLAAVLVIFTACHWDQRTPWMKYLDQTTAAPKDLIADLPSTPVYWEGSPTPLWFLAKRPSYISCDQGTGTLFDRQTAIVFQKRFASITPLNTQDTIFLEICPPDPHAAQHPVTAATLSMTCRNQPDLGAMVLLHEIPGALYKTWTAPVPYTYVDNIAHPPKFISTRQFYIYNCAALK